MTIYNTEKFRISQGIKKEKATLEFVISNYILAAMMSEAGVPWWVTGIHVIANAALNFIVLKRYHDGNTAFDEMRALEERTHR